MKENACRSVMRSMPNTPEACPSSAERSDPPESFSAEERVESADRRIPFELPQANFRFELKGLKVSESLPKRGEN